jgi:GTP-binding protein
MLLMKKRAIVTDSREPAKKQALPTLPGPLEGASFVIGAASATQLPAEGAPEIAFAGRSNAGKSSAINALARRTGLAHASRTPGRTRQINFFRMRNGALVADLPGYGYAAVPREIKRAWQDLLWSYVTSRSALVGLVLIVDARHGLKALDTDVLSAFLPSARPVLILATKSDKLNVAEQRRAIADIRAALATTFGERAHAVSVIGFSATSRTGVVEADRAIEAWLE